MKNASVRCGKNWIRKVFDQYTEQTLWNVARDTELRRRFTQVEEIRRKKGIPHEQTVHDRLWNKRPDGIVFKMPTTTTGGVICLLEFKRMSDVTNHYIVRVKREAVAQYESLRSALDKTTQYQGWTVKQVSFVSGVWSLNEEELKKNLEYFKVPSTGTLHAHLTENPITGTLPPDHLWDPRLLLSILSQSVRLTKLGNTRRERKRRGNN